MQKKILALLLSGLVLPGLGQLYLGRRKQGALVLVLINLLLIAALFVVLPGVGKLMLAAQLDTAAGAGIIEEWLDTHRGAGRLFLLCFLGIWGYAVIDILKGGRENDGP